MAEKDRFGDKLRDVEKAREDQFFQQRDRELLERIRLRKEAEKDAAERPATYMRCPKCGEALAEQVLDGVIVDQCAACGGLWLDKGELETLVRREEKGWLARVLSAGR